MGYLDRYQGPGGGLLTRYEQRQERAVRQNTGLQLTRVRAQGLVFQEECHEIDRLARVCMAGQAMLAEWADVLSNGNPLRAQELYFFSNVARIGKGEVLANAIATWTRGAEL